MSYEKWFSIKQYYIKSEYNNGLAGNTKQPSSGTLLHLFLVVKMYNQP